ncbi:MAG: hypothetical protein M1497_00530 [Nitrospirae bacterium]|nr:hypothetical protein [Nitrospirota bacterium]
MKNCWEFMQCGREKNSGLGVCPAATEVRANGVNGGTNGGRVCWAVAGTFCAGEVQGTYAQKLKTCASCAFRLTVREEVSYKFKHIYF